MSNGNEVPILNIKIIILKGYKKHSKIIGKISRCSIRIIIRSTNQTQQFRSINVGLIFTFELRINPFEEVFFDN